MGIRNVVIIGSGCAGHTAALYTARAKLEPLVIEGHEPGGQLSLTTLVENFPGSRRNSRARADRQHAPAGRAFWRRIPDGSRHRSGLSKRPFTLTVGKETIQTRSLIIASGASARWLGLPSEQALIGHGVSSCATCDGFFFSGKDIAVIGGGDSAMEEAIFLTRFATKVSLIHRRDEFRAPKSCWNAHSSTKRSTSSPNTVVEQVLTIQPRKRYRPAIRNVRDRKNFDLPVSAMFLGIGHIPNAKSSTASSTLIGDGYLKTRASFSQGAGRIRLRRRAGPALSSGHNRRRHRLHGRARGREVPLRPRD